MKGQYSTRILLQDTISKHYYCLLDLWTTELRAAFDFRHTARAIEFAYRNGLRNVQLVVKFDDQPWDEILPLPVPIGALAPAAAR